MLVSAVVNRYRTIEGLYRDAIDGITVMHTNITVLLSECPNKVGVIIGMLGSNEMCGERSDIGPNSFTSIV